MHDPVRSGFTGLVTELPICDCGIAEICWGTVMKGVGVLVTIRVRRFIRTLGFLLHDMVGIWAA